MPHLDQLFSCITKGDLNRLITLINRNIPLVNATNEEGINLLQYSVLQDQQDIIIYLVNHSECQLTSCDSHYQHTVLHTACLLDSVKAAQTIVHKLKPMELNAQDKFGWTALHHACRNGNVYLCKLLIQHKAKPGLQNKLGKAPIHYATQYGYHEIVKMLYDLVGPSVTPNPIEKLSLPILTLMHCAAMNGHTHLVQWLQSVYYPPNIKCRRALHQNGEITSDELPEETAGKRGYLSLKAAIQSYNTQYEMWLQDINGDCSSLDYVKLCLCGPVDSGKTTLKDRLERTSLQLMLGIGLDSNESSEAKKHTYGIDVSNLQVSSREGFSLWDFCGDTNSYVTHCHFLTSEHTGYIIVLDLTTPTDQLQHQLDEWLMAVKNHNLGSELVYQCSKRQPDIVAFSTSSGPFRSRGSERSRASTMAAPTKRRDRLYSTGSRPLISSQIFNARTQSAIDQSPPTSPSASKNLLSSPVKSLEIEILPSVSQVPVIVVGSHFDCLQSSKEKKAVLQKMDGIINEASKKYYKSLNVIQQVFPVSGGDKTSTSEVRYLKEQLIAVRNLLIENSQKFPHIFDKVAKKIESLKIEFPEQKIWDVVKLCSVVRTDVNGLLSDSQITHILRHLHNTGIVIYTHALSQWVFMDPSWLCSALGYIFSPASHPNHILCKNGEITRKILQTYLPSCSNPSDITTLLKILRNLEIGYSSTKTDRSESYRFSCINEEEGDESTVWSPDDRFVKYNGRIMLPCNDIDFLPAGFVPRLHMHMVYLMNGKGLRTFNQGFLLDKTDHQCLVKVEKSRRSISFIGRMTMDGEVSNCVSTMDYAQQSVAKLCRIMCPAIFFKWSILNPVSLKNHDPLPPCFPATMVAVATRRKVSITSAKDTPLPHLDTTEMMFFGDSELMLKGTGLGLKVAYLDDHILEQMGQLLAEDGIQPGWKTLAMHLNLSEYIEILEGESHPVKKLVLKWGEKPRWTIDSLLYALKGVNREDTFDYLRAKTNPKYDTTVEV